MSEEPTWISVVLAGMGVFQTIALAYIASRSRRVRSTDQRGEHEAP